MDTKNIPKFWSLSLKEGQSHKLTVPKTAYLNITNVCIQQVNPSNASKPGRLYALCSKHNVKLQQPSIIASLYPQQVEQVTLNFQLAPTETAEFSVKGPHQIDIVGYLAPLDFDADDSDFGVDDDTDSSSYEEDD